MSEEQADAIGFMKMFEMFRGPEEEKSGSGVDYERMFKMMEIMMAFQKISEQRRAFRERRPEPAPEPETSAAGYAENLELRLRAPELQTIKSAIPLLEPKYRKNLSVFVKLIEIQRLMDVYREMTENMRTRGMEADGDGWRVKMLLHLRRYLSTENQLRVDALVKLMEMNNIFSRIRLS